MPTTEESFLLGHDATIETDDKDNAAVHSSTRPRLLLAMTFLVVMAVVGVLSGRSLQSTSTLNMLVKKYGRRMQNPPVSPIKATDFGPNPWFKLGMCAGDCDGTFEQCDDGLYCQQRDTGDHLPRGCYGDPVKDYDYCAPFLPTIDFGPNPSKKLGPCEGDCDTDGDCDGALVCHHRGNDDTEPPGCVGAGKLNYDYCVYPKSTYKPMTNIGPNPMRSLGRCEGDCDDDYDCDHGLVCHQRDIGDPVPTGCFGTIWTDWDYCVPRNTVNDFGNNPEGHFPLGQCEGDCDSDLDCQRGLVCYFYSATWEEEDVPGCIGEPIRDHDYCVLREDAFDAGQRKNNDDFY